MTMARSRGGFSRICRCSQPAACIIMGLTRVYCSSFHPLHPFPKHLDGTSIIADVLGSGIEARRRGAKRLEGGEAWDRSFVAIIFSRWYASVASGGAGMVLAPEYCCGCRRPGPCGNAVPTAAYIGSRNVLFGSGVALSLNRS